MQYLGHGSWKTMYTIMIPTILMLSYFEIFEVCPGSL